MNDNWDVDKLRKLAGELGIGSCGRHIFFCGGDACCGDSGLGQESWDLLKTRIKELKLAEGPNPVYRTRVLCLRLCQQGPIAVVYPEGIWYHHLHGERLERVITEHLAGGHPVLEYSFSEAPLPPTSLLDGGNQDDQFAS